MVKRALHNSFESNDSFLKSSFESFAPGRWGPLWRVKRPLSALPRFSLSKWCLLSRVAFGELFLWLFVWFIRFICMAYLWSLFCVVHLSRCLLLSKRHQFSAVHWCKFRLIVRQSYRIRAIFPRSLFIILFRSIRYRLYRLANASRKSHSWMPKFIL